MMIFSPLLGQAAAPGGGMYQLFFFGLMFLIFWLFMLRPQNKKQKLQRQFLEDLKVGDKVVTASGILGKVVRVDDQTVTLDVGKTQLQFTKNAVSKELTDAIYPAAE